MSVGNGGATTFPFLRTSSQAGHLGRSAGLIDEDKLVRIKSWLTIKPIVSAGELGADLIEGGFYG